MENYYSLQVHTCLEEVACILAASGPQSKLHTTSDRQIGVTVFFCYFPSQLGGVGCIFADCTSRYNCESNMVHECGMKQACFAFWISSEQEFVGFMGVSERKKRENTDRERKLSTPFNLLATAWVK